MATCCRRLLDYWLRFSQALGAGISLVILSLIFFGLVTPVGLLRRAMGKDPLQLQRWQDGRGTVFRSRAHRFVRQDLEHPY